MLRNTNQNTVLTFSALYSRTPAVFKEYDLKKFSVSFTKRVMFYVSGKHSRKPKRVESRSDSSSSSRSTSSSSASKSNGVALFESILKDSVSVKQEVVESPPSQRARDQHQEDIKPRVVNLKSKGRPQSAVDRSKEPVTENSASQEAKLHTRPKSAKYRARRGAERNRPFISSSSASSLSAFDEDSASRSEADFGEFWG